MQDAAGLLALLILGGALVAAITGARALMATPPDSSKLKLAAWLLTLPWAIALVFGGRAAGLVVADLLTGGVMIVWPLVTLALLTGVWLRRRRTRATNDTAVRASAPETPRIVRAPMAWSRRVALMGALRFPAPAASAIALAIVLSLSWLIFRPGRSRGHYGGLAEMGWEMLVSDGTLALTVLAVVLAVLFAARPAPSLAVTYSWLALAIVAGDVNLWMVDYWHHAAEFREWHYAIAPLLMWTSLAALTPAIVAQIAHAVRWYRESDELQWHAHEIAHPAFSDRTRFIWLVAVPAVPGLLLCVAGLLFWLMRFVDLPPAQLRQRWTDAFYLVAGAGSFWSFIGLPVTAIMAGIGWVAVATAGEVYRRWWKHLTIASFVGWVITAMVWP